MPNQSQWGFVESFGGANIWAVPILVYPKILKCLKSNYKETAKIDRETNELLSAKAQFPRIFICTFVVQKFPTRGIKCWQDSVCFNIIYKSRI